MGKRLEGDSGGRRAEAYTAVMISEREWHSNAGGRVRSPDAEEAAQRAKVVWVLRATFLFLSVVVLSLGIVTGSGQTGWEFARWWWWALVVTMLFFMMIVTIDVLTPRRKLSMISAILFGSFAGILATLLVGFVIDVFTKTYDLDVAYAQPILTGKVLLGLGLCYLGITTVLQTQDDFRLVIPYVEFSKRYRGSKPLILDTSALIDGRILDLTELGVFTSEIVIPRFVVAELQLLADSEDRMKRAKGRRGLDFVSRVQRSPRVDVSIAEEHGSGRSVDHDLVELASSMPGIIVTTDSGLSRVGSIHGVTVLNLNEIAHVMRSGYSAPGERLRLRIVRAGEQPGQGVGYLEDGCMVVVDGGMQRIGEESEVVVTGTMQTSAGRLIFARLEGMEETASTGAEEPRQEENNGRAGPPSGASAEDSASDDPPTPDRGAESAAGAEADDVPDGPGERQSTPESARTAPPPRSQSAESPARNPRRRG